MGSGIAETIAIAGTSLVLCEVDDRAVEAARGRIEVSLDRAVARGKLDEQARDDALDRIHLTTDFGELAGSDLVV